MCTLTAAKDVRPFSLLPVLKLHSELTTFNPFLLSGCQFAGLWGCLSGQRECFPAFFPSHLDVRGFLLESYRWNSSSRSVFLLDSFSSLAIRKTPAKHHKHFSRESLARDENRNPPQPVPRECVHVRARVCACACGTLCTSQLESLFITPVRLL